MSSYCWQIYSSYLFADESLIKSLLWKCRREADVYRESNKFEDVRGSQRSEWGPVSAVGKIYSFEAQRRQRQDSASLLMRL